MKLRGKTAVVIGGASGICLATARNCLKEGLANVFLLDIESKEINQQLKHELEHEGIDLLVMDIAKREIVEKIFKIILKRCRHIDIVINCAGPDCTVSVSSIDIISTSLSAMDIMSKAKGGRGGVIINILPIAGLTASVGKTNNNVLKRGVIGFTQTMAEGIYFSQHAVRFVVICLRTIQTPAKTDVEELNDLHHVVTPTPSRADDDCAKSILLVTATTSNGAIWIVEKGAAKEVTPKEFGIVK